MMKTILINKKKAIQKEMVENAFQWILASFLLTAIIGLSAHYLELTFKSATNYAILITCIFGLIFSIHLIYKMLIIRKLKYEYSGSELHTEYQIIVTTKLRAKLQIVNSVDIVQTIYDKLFGFYTLKVNYGFADDGYTHHYDYLSEEQSETIANEIKPYSKLGVMIKKTNTEEQENGKQT